MQSLHSKLLTFDDNEDICEFNKESILTENTNLGFESVSEIKGKLDDILSEVKDLPKKISEVIQKNNTSQISVDQPMTSRSSNDNLCSVEPDIEKLLNDIKNANSMSSIKNNKLIANKFLIYKNEEDDTEYMKCEVCSKWDNLNSVKKLGQALIDGSEYSVYEAGVKHAMT